MAPLCARDYPEEDLRSRTLGVPSYYPAQLGKILDKNRLVILRKLGCGAYSSVWLVRDRSQANASTCAVAVLKVFTETQRTAAKQHPSERDFIEKISSKLPSHRGYSHLPAFLGTRDPFGGRHLCLLTEALCENVYHLRFPLEGQVYHPDDRPPRTSGRLDLAATGKVIQHTLLALEYLHYVCGIIHADIKDDNILIRPHPTMLVQTVSQTLFRTPSLSYLSSLAWKQDVLSISGAHGLPVK
ncbi:kinase-like domain-containing protein [Pterulicium gracile]|uniref:non-specific serine/threonine protein kinase n=1 Tax=Pterulicium gracile TaxID=1884261 RepID=A0A5C3QSH4_9AGAR|nr:kinase-like domain-containing protein [Pterula gracilis]